MGYTGMMDVLIRVEMIHAHWKNELVQRMDNSEKQLNLLQEQLRKERVDIDEAMQRHKREIGQYEEKLVQVKTQYRLRLEMKIREMKEQYEAFWNKRVEQAVILKNQYVKSIKQHHNQIQQEQRAENVIRLEEMIMKLENEYRLYIEQRQVELNQARTREHHLNAQITQKTKENLHLTEQLTALRHELTDSHVHAQHYQSLYTHLVESYTQHQCHSDGGTALSDARLEDK